MDKARKQLETLDKTIIGLTGTFGSGKSTAAGLFEELGAFVCQADRLAHEALLSGNEVYKNILAAIPEVKKDKSGKIDRQGLADIIFGDDAKKRNALEAVIHPYVLKRFVEEASDAQAKVLVFEVPLLFEAGFDVLCDLRIVIKARPEVIQERMTGFSHKEYLRRTKAQWSSKKKEAKADFIIDNSADLEKTKKQIQKIWWEITNE